MPYTEGFKARMIERMAGPEGISARALAKEVGVAQPTLSRWLRQRSLGGMSDEPRNKKRKSWSPAEKLRVVHAAMQLRDDELGELLRREGLYEAQLREWIDAANAAAMAGLSSSKRSRSKKSPEQKRIVQLEKELQRKDRALAEVTALLALKKRVQEIWGDEDDDTDTRSGT